KKECVCSEHRIQKYMAKISGPFLDRVDLQVEVPLLQMDELFSEDASAEPSEAARSRVERARKIQWERYKEDGKGRLNSHLRPVDLKRYCKLDEASKLLLKTAVERLNLSARAFDRIRKVARTIADLEASNDLKSPHIAEAIQYRALDRKPTLI